MSMETFEEYWEQSPGFGSLKVIDTDLAKAMAQVCYVAGQAAAAKWLNQELKRRGI